MCVCVCVLCLAQCIHREVHSLHRRLILMSYDLLRLKSSIK